jgi:hypothetical protein
VYVFKKKKKRVSLSLSLSLPLSPSLPISFTVAIFTALHLLLDLERSVLPLIVQLIAKAFDDGRWQWPIGIAFTHPSFGAVMNQSKTKGKGKGKGKGERERERVREERREKRDK